MASLDINFNGIDQSDALTELIESQANKLEHFFDNIQSCKVVVSAPHRHHHHKYFHVQIQLLVPRNVLVVNHEPEKNERHQDAYSAVNDAFAAMTRQLESYVTKLHGKTKFHIKPQPSSFLGEQK